jgi:hypothetical protein
MAPGLDGVAHVAVVADPVAHRWTAREKLMSLLLLGLGILGPQTVKAIARDAVTVSSHRWGVHIGAIPIDSGHWLGWPRGGSTVLGRRALGLLLEGNTKEPLCLVKPLIGLRVWRVRDIFMVASSGCHVVG